MMIRIILLFLLIIARHRVSASSSTTKRLINSSNSNTEYPRALSLKQFSSILNFDRYERFEEYHELEILANSDESWESKVSSFWTSAEEIQENTIILHKEGSSSKNVKNEAQQLHPFLLCHLDKNSTSGRQRYKIIKEEITKKENDYNSDFFMNELPVYNYNFDVDEYESQKQQQGHEVERESDEEEIPYGACFYGSMSYVVAKDIKGSNTLFVTPMFSDLKIRRGASLMSNDENTDHERTIAVFVQLSPGIATSQQQVMELAYTLLDIEKNISEDSSLPSCIESSLLLTSMSVTVSSIDISSFTYEVDKSNNKQNIISNECVIYFIEYFAKQSQVLSVSPVFQTMMLNDIASWIIQGYPEENDSRPWFEEGITGEGEIVQLLDSGIDESSCYLKDASGEVPLTTNYDLTGGRIDITKRKIVQYVALNSFNGDRVDGTSHGTHVATTIAGKRSDDGVTEIDGMVDGISPGVKLAFFDAHNDPPDNDNTLAIPYDIQFLFYFGRQAGARIHSASWGVLENAEYTERVRLIDSYFYNDPEDEFIMFAAAGNDGLNGNSTIFDPSLAKNVISVGASHSHGDDLSNNMLGMNYIAAFSSRGPTDDGRIKPDIVAPGHSILSAAAANTNECDPAVRPKYDPDNKKHAGLMFMSGTSMACPVAVGAGALVRQYFREVYDPSIDISGTLLKAVLVNGGEALVGRSKFVEGTDFDISTQYDEFQGFGKVNLMNSLKHPSPNIHSPDVHVEDARVLQQGQTHEYEFIVCDDREFRVTIVWKDPPNGSTGCQRCLVNDLDLEVELDGQVYHPNGKTEKDDRNNVERVIIDSSDISNLEQTVYVRVKASNLGYGQVQKYSLASNGCINNVNFVTPTPSPTDSCGNNEFEYVLEVFTDRAPEDTSWILEYQGSGGIIDTGIAEEYDKRLNKYKKKGCARFDCFIFVMRDSKFDGLCCSKGMGSYKIRAGNEILVESDSFRDRQEIEKFCHFGSFTEDPTASPTFVCKDDEFKYRIDINTDLYPDETRWELRHAKVDGINPGTYTESYKEYEHEGCLAVDSCVSFFVYSNSMDIDHGEFTIIADDFVVAERYGFDNFETKEFCYSGQTNRTLSYGIRTAVVGNNDGDKFDDVHSPWQYGKISKIEVWTYSHLGLLDFIGITYESGQLYEHGTKNEYGDQHNITLGEDQYIAKVSGRSGWRIFQLIFETNDGEVFGPYGNDYYGEGSPFEFDFSGNLLVYIFGRADSYRPHQVGFAHASLPQTITDSPTAQPTSFPCDAGQFRYQIIIRTGYSPEEVWWELYSLPFANSVPYMTYSKQLEAYSHTGCLTYDSCYELRILDKRRDGLCCYFGSGSYKLSVGDDVLVQGNHFDDAITVGYWYDPDYVFNVHEFCYDRQPSEAPPSFANQPTPKPSEIMACSDDEFEYRIRVKTDYWPDWISWEFKYLDGTVIERVEDGEYFLEHHEHNHRGCLPLNNCFEFYISTDYFGGLCCSLGNGGYTILANDFVMAEVEGETGYWYEQTHTFCYGPSYSFSPSLALTSSSHPSILPSSKQSSNPSIQPSTKTSSFCNENEFKYEVIVTTDSRPWQTSWELSYNDGTLINSVEEGEYTERYTEHVHEGCQDLNSCVIFTIYDLYGDGIFLGGYTIMANDVVMAEGGDGLWNKQTHEFCFGPSYSLQPSSSPTTFCSESEFKYIVVVTTDYYPEETSWKLNYINGTVIDSIEEKEFTHNYFEHVHEGCIELDSCVIFTIFDSFGNGICCSLGNGGYMVLVGDVVMAEGGEFDYNETKTFCYGPSVTNYPSSSDICKNGSNNHNYCGFWASLGLCEDNNVQDWMLENCAKACSNCCMDYDEWGCEYGANLGVCTDTSIIFGDITTQELAQASCRVSCDTCDLDFTPSPTTPTVTCTDDQFKYEIIVTNDDDDYSFNWYLYYKYPEQIDGYEKPEKFYNQKYGIIDGFGGYFPPNNEKKSYGCASYSCFDLQVVQGYVKMYDTDKNILIAQNTERAQRLRLCHYQTQPTTSPITTLKEAIFTITLLFSTTSLYKEENISSVSHRSIQKILFHFNEIYEYNPFIAVEYSFCEEFKCDVSFRVCNNESCNNNDEVLQPNFLAFIANSLKEAEANGLLLLTLKQTGHHMMVAEIFNNIKNDIVIEFDFDYDTWPTTSPTTSPSSTPEQNCNAPTVIQNLFGFITNIFQPITQAITNTADPISDVVFGVESYSSTAITTCKDKMFELQLEIKTDGNPDKTSWELLYENGTIIESIGRDTYSEFNAVYNHSYCLDTSCFVFNLFDSFEFKGSYEITAGNSTLAQQDSFLWWTDSKQFCYPQCDDDDMFALQIDVVTDPWPHETSWQLAFANGTLIDSVDEGYYTGLNTSYSHRYCLQEDCYSVTFHDHIGDGMCCSYGDGSYMIKINDDEIAVKQGGKFEESESTTFCYPFDDVSCKGCEDDEKSLFEKITHILSKQREV